jgi:Gpi18-like mannosyltransferase
MENFGWIVSVAASVVFWGIVLVMFFRICAEAGMKFSVFAKARERFSRVKLLNNSGNIEIFKVFAFALTVRLFVFVLGFFIMLAGNNYAPSFDSLFSAFHAWDSRHYISIAQYGYSWVEYVGGEPRNLLLVFFPLYGWLVRLFGFFVGDYWVSAYVVSTLAFSAGMCFLFRLVKFEFNKNVAWWSVLFLSFAPPAFFFGTPMTESLMVLTSSAALYYIRTHKWGLAGLFGALAVLTRMVGLVLFVVFAVEFFTHFKIFELVRNRDWKTLFHHAFTKGIFIFVILLGGVLYLVLNWQVSVDPFRFMHYQEVHWFNATQYFGQTIEQQLNIITQGGGADMVRWTHIPNVLAFVFSIALLVYACVKKLPSAYIVYVLGYTFISFSPAWLLSGARYMVACVPLFIFAGFYAEKKPMHGLVALAFSFMGMFVLLREFLSGGFVI